MVALVGLSLLAAPAGAQSSDTIYFKDGMRTVCGGNAWERGDEIHCEYDGGLLIYRTSDVARIEKGRSVEPEQGSERTQAIDTPRPNPVLPVPVPKAGTASSAAPKSPGGITFYDPRRPKKYWSSASRQHDTFREAIAALADEFNRPAGWVEANLGDSNELSDIRESLAVRLAESAAADAKPTPKPEDAIEFYNPRRAHKYMTGPDAHHNGFHDALEALARDFNQSAEWVERNMGESNDVDQIRQNLDNAQQTEIDR